MADDTINIIDKSDLQDPERRGIMGIGIATGAVAAVGAGAACIPFIDSMNPTADVLAKATTEIDVSDIAVGDARTVIWQGKPVFVMHRTAEQIAQVQENDGGKDPQPDSERTQKPEWLIVIGVCTHLGCIPNTADAGWFCPCHGSVYDYSGRILEGPAPTNLEVPFYEFLTDTTVRIGKKV